MIPPDPLCLSTWRLTLIPFSADLLGLILTDRPSLERRLSARFLPRWNWEGAADYLAKTRRAVEPDPASRVWRIYFILHNDDKVVIGDVGFKGPPDRHGAVEFHCGLEPEYQGRGYGFEAARALFDWSFTHPEVRVITAVCDHDNAAVIRLNKKLHMRRVRVQGRLLWWLSTGLGRLQKLGLRGVSAFLQRQLWRGLRALQKLGVRVNPPSLVWHLSRSRWAEHATRSEPGGTNSSMVLQSSRHS